MAVISQHHVTNYLWAMPKLLSYTTIFNNILYQWWIFQAPGISVLWISFYSYLNYFRKISYKYQCLNLSDIKKKTSIKRLMHVYVYVFVMREVWLPVVEVNVIFALLLKLFWKKSSLLCTIVFNSIPEITINNSPTFM